MRILQTNRTLIQTATGAWPANDSGWTTLPLAYATDFMDGWCNDMGSATIIVPSGNIAGHGETVVSLRAASLIGPVYIRICILNDTGLIEDESDGALFLPAWAGIISGYALQPGFDDHGWETILTCAGGGAILDQVTPLIHWAEPQATATDAADIGNMPVFNEIGGKKTGNRSSAKWDFGSQTAYVFDMSGDGEEFTTADIVEYILAICSNNAPAIPSFVVEGQTSALFQKDKFDLKGKSGLGMLVAVLNPRRGLGFTIFYDYAANGFGIDVVSLHKTAITTSEGTVPANNRQKTLDLSDSSKSTTFKISGSYSSQVDEVAIIMKRTAIAGTLSLDHIEPDWTPGDEAIRDALDEDDPANDQERAARVGRRFKIKDDWDGTLVGGYVIPNSRVTDTNQINGNGGYTGDINAASGSFVKNANIKMLRTLPVPDGYDWTSPPSDQDLTTSKMKPMVFVRDGGGIVTTLADYCGLTDINVTIDRDGSSFTLGPAAVADQVLDILAFGEELFITLGLEVQLNPIISWLRDSASMPRGSRRTISKDRNDLFIEFIAPGTHMGCKDDDFETVGASAIFIHDDTAIAESALVAMVPWYRDHSAEITRTVRGDAFDISVVEGDFITTATFEHASGTVTIDVNSVVTAVKRSLGDDGACTITTKRIAAAEETF